MTIVAMGPNKTHIPNLDQMIQDRINQVGGEKRMKHVLIRQQIIAMRISRLRSPCHWADSHYESRLAHLRQQLRETR